MGERVGRSTVSRVAKRLDERRANAAECTHRDGLSPLPVPGRDVPRCPLGPNRSLNVSALVAYAVEPSDGHRRLLGITLGTKRNFGEQLVGALSSNSLERGLSGVQLVIADEHAGLAAAVRRLPARGAPPALYCPPATQRCWPRSRIACASVWRARLPPSSGPPGSLSRRSAWPRSRRAGFQGAPTRQSTCLSERFTAATQFYAFPEPHWARLRTTNSLERLHTEIKRRIRSCSAPSPTEPARSASSLRLL